MYTVIGIYWELISASIFIVDFTPTDADTSLQKSMGFGISIDTINVNTDSKAHRFL